MNGITKTYTVLDEIVATKPAQIEALALQYGDLLETRATKSTKSLYQALKNNPTGFILECKKASPSKGLIRENFDPVSIAKIYEKYAIAISVLTDELFFQGDFVYLHSVSQAVSLPVLCKDFIIDERQLRLARHLGADAALLMLSVLDDELYLALAKEADLLGLDVLTEVSNEKEMQRAIALNAKIIGINNRNLRDLSIDLNMTKKLAALAPKHAVLISESGIYTHQEAREISPLVNGFLVGSSLTEQSNIDLACRKLIYGNIKVCGLTRLEDAKAVENAGAVYGGLIFAKNSPRCINIEKAKSIMQSGDLLYVGVFVDQDAKEVASIANELKLFAVQLHGDESQDYVQKLKEKLNTSQVWKAVKPDGSNKINNANRFVFDSASANQFGGTGKVFDWQVIGDEKHQAMLAGGLNENNLAKALALNFFGYDLNSGVETTPGIKNEEKIRACIKLARQY